MAGVGDPDRPSPGGERYRPLPGLTGLPAHLWAALSPRARAAVGALAVLALLAAGWAAVVLVPSSRDQARQREQGEQARQRALRAERARLTALAARPRSGVLASARPPAAPDAERERRQRMVGMLEATVLRDARARARRGELEGRPRRVRCSPFPASVHSPAPQDDLGRRRGRYECLAVLREFGATEGTEAGALGHLYRAQIDFGTSRYALCKVSAVPGEGGFTPSAPAPYVPVACGG
jgi:hypothetical protein